MNHSRVVSPLVLKALIEDAEAVAKLNDAARHFHIDADTLEYSEPDHKASLEYFTLMLVE
jgi:hypothetical protein